MDHPTKTNQGFGFGIAILVMENGLAVGFHGYLLPGHGNQLGSCRLPTWIPYF